MWRKQLVLHAIASPGGGDRARGPQCRWPPRPADEHAKERKSGLPIQEKGHQSIDVDHVSCVHEAGTPRALLSKSWHASSRET
jgi:hypothetical protein